jgi:iron uptake system component EfeO
MRNGARVLGALIAIGLAGCGSTDGESGSNEVAFTLNEAGCTPVDSKVAAGPTTFKITNGGTSRVSEMELKDESGTILGESENVVEGVPGQFSLNVEPGRYIVSCPNGDTDDQGTLVAAGKASGQPTRASAGLLADASASYRRYIEDQTAELRSGVENFQAAIDSGDLTRAKALFGPVRRHYEAVEPVAESFGDLDPEIDARVNDVPNVKDWTGFHRIERTLWQDRTTKGTEQYAGMLTDDVKTLQRKVKTIKLQPAQIANGSVELLNEVASWKITGEEDRYSHTDLSDFQGNLEGSREAFVVLRPALRSEGDEALVKTIDDRFAAVQKGLDKYRRNTALGFALYEELTPADRRRLAQQIDALAEPLSIVAAKVSGA